MPRTSPWRRRSKGRAASSARSSVAAAPLAKKPDPIHSIILSLVTSSAVTQMTRLQRPALIQSWARERAWVPEAQAALI